MSANFHSEAYSAPAPPPPLLDGLFSTAVSNRNGIDPNWRDMFDDEDEVEEEFEPVAASSLTTLRPYQQKAVQNVIEAHESGIMAPLVVSATGTGKSLMLGQLAKHYEPRGVLLLVHRDELIRQLANSCARLGLATGIEKANKRGMNGFGVSHSVVVGSVQTMQANRLLQWAPDAFGCIIIDEAHHAISRTYANVYSRFGWSREAPQNGPLLCGFTATPDRADKKNVGALFGCLAFEYSLRAAVKDGYLVKPQVLQLETEPPIDLRGLRTTKQGDFCADDLEEIIIANLNPLANALKDCADLTGRRAAAFFPDIESARLGAAAFEKVGLTANWVSGVCRDRKQKLEDHQNGRFQILCNSMLLTEGYDDPDISAVILCRPTKSRGLKSQMVGRGTRPNKPSGFTDLLIIDFDWQIDGKTLVKAVELFNDGSIPDEVMDVARELEDEGKGGDLEELLADAERVHSERVKERIRRQKIPMRGKMFDPLGLAEFLEIPVHKQGYEWAEVRTATPKQLAALGKFGVAVPTDLAFATAKGMLDKLIGRAEKGWASLWDVNALIDSGIDGDVARGLRSAEAKAQLAEINASLPASSGQLWVLESKYGIAPPAGLSKADATKMLSQLKREQP